MIRRGAELMVYENFDGLRGDDDDGEAKKKNSTPHGEIRVSTRELTLSNRAKLVGDVEWRCRVARAQRTRLPSLGTR